VELAIAKMAESLGYDVAFYAGEAGMRSLAEVENIVSWDGLVDGFNKVAMSSAQMAAIAAATTYSGHKINEWISGIFNAGIDDIKADIKSGSAAASGSAAVLLAIGKMFKGKNITSDIVTVIKTYMQGLAAAAHRMVFDANKDVVKGVEWCAAMENANASTGRGTCVRCQALDGVKYYADDDRPPMPLHLRCRCMFLPITKTWEDLGIDAEEASRAYRRWTERDLSSRTTIDYGWTDKAYKDWYASKSKEWQNNAVGKRRAELLRAGIIKFSDLVDTKTGRLILLKDLPDLRAE
jgi:hypothetical protein